MIAAGVLGAVALIALYLAFGRSFFGSSTTTATVKITASPKATGSPSANNEKFRLPTADEQKSNNETTLIPVVYPGNISAPDAGRNIFAFYEPPEPCKAGDTDPRCQTPIPSPSPVKPPTPLPPPPILIAGFSPSNVYAGASGFRLEITGDKFTPDSHIYFNQSELPTTFINTQKMVADVPASNIATEGQLLIIVQTPDGKLYSNSVSISVQAPPKPTIMYIGMIGHKGYNNDKAVLAENDKAAPFAARLNDIIGGRFRLIEISPAEVIFQDTGLGFKHRVPITKGANTGTMPPGRGSDINPTYPPGFIPQDIPGIPNNLQQYQQNPDIQRKMELQKQQEIQKQKEDVDDEGDG